MGVVAATRPFDGAAQHSDKAARGKVDWTPGADTNATEGHNRRKSHRQNFKARRRAVRESVRIADFIGTFIQLNAGSNPRGACPFHPLPGRKCFVIYPDQKRAHCWSCGWKGDVLAFASDFLNLRSRNALKWLEAFAAVRPVQNLTPMACSL